MPSQVEDILIKSQHKVFLAKHNRQDLKRLQSPNPCQDEGEMKQTRITPGGEKELRLVETKTGDWAQNEDKLDLQRISCYRD